MKTIILKRLSDFKKEVVSSTFKSIRGLYNEMEQKLLLEDEISSCIIKANLPSFEILEKSLLKIRQRNLSRHVPVISLPEPEKATPGQVGHLIKDTCLGSNRLRDDIFNGFGHSTRLGIVYNLNY